MSAVVGKRKLNELEEEASTSALVLASEHAFSLEVAEQVAELERAPPRGVLACCSAAGLGLVELTLQAGRREGYGARPWPVVVGGAGLGDAPELALALGLPPRAPLAVRFGVPIAMSGVDDAGCCDAMFWEGIEARPSLRAIAERAVAWLEGTHLDAATQAEERKRWEESQTHWYSKHTVIESYRNLARHPALLATDDAAVLSPEWLAPALRPLLAARDATAAAAAAAHVVAGSGVAEVGRGIFGLDLFTADFCAMLLAERYAAPCLTWQVDHFEASSLPRRRPNTMNNYGLVLSDCGFEPIMSQLLQRVVAPLSAALYPHEAVARQLDHHHTFTVAYDAHGGDKGLDMHHDASEVTLNVCLGRDFEGATLRFCGRFGASDHRRYHRVYSHVVGRSLLHLGRHRHGADDIMAGERVNLIMWARSSAFRAAAAFGHIEPDGYPKAVEAADAPDRICLSRENDDDYAEQLQWFGEEPLPTEQRCMTGKCPVRSKKVM